MGTREQSHAKKSSPGFAINRYAKKPEGTHQPKLPAPSVSKQPREKEPAAKPKLKAKTGSEVAVTKKQERQIKQFSDLADTTKKVGTVFGIKKSEIMLAVTEGNIDHAISVFRRQAYSTIVNLIPIAEKEYVKGKRDHQAYVLNALITQGRELAADLMQDGDRTQLANKLVHEMLEPVFKGILQNVVSELQQQKLMLSDKLQPEYKAHVSIEIDASAKRIAGAMTDLFSVASDQIRRNLIGD